MLRVEQVGKAYIEYKSILHRVGRWLGLGVRPASEVWVLDSVSFSVAPGEAVALLGSNGAGKSTMLKMIAGIVRPNRGGIHVDGKIGAIIELGMGFNPELTGRQNVRQAAGLMGMSAAEIDALMPDIIEFTELGEFFDRPVRIYSSGMTARLAFAVATSIRPDLLVIDEVLSVGDAYFQVKSFSRFKKLKDSGCSIVLVSHDIQSVKTVCDRAILLESGRIVKDGPAAEICDYYQAMTTSRLADAQIAQEFRDNRVVTRSGSGKIKVLDIVFARAETPEVPAEVIESGEDMVLSVTLSAETEIESLTQGFLIRDRRGNDIYGTNTFYMDRKITDIAQGSNVVVRFRMRANLNAGVYSISVAAVNSHIVLLESYDWIENAAVFEVINTKRHYSIGTTMLDVSVEHFAVEKDSV